MHFPARFFGARFLYRAVFAMKIDDGGITARRTAFQFYQRSRRAVTLLFARKSPEFNPGKWR